METIEQKIASIIESSLSYLGYEIVRILLIGGEKRNRLQIMLDRVDGEEIKIDDCERASKQISALLEVEDPINSAYILEVSSPGIDRPLTREKDFKNYAGNEISLELKNSHNGRKRFKGQLLGINEHIVEMEVEDLEEKILKIAFSEIKQAKLVLNSKLLNKSRG